VQFLYSSQLLRQDHIGVVAPQGIAVDEEFGLFSSSTHRTEVYRKVLHSITLLMISVSTAPCLTVHPSFDFGVCHTVLLFAQHDTAFTSVP